MRLVMKPTIINQMQKLVNKVEDKTKLAKKNLNNLKANQYYKPLCFLVQA